MVKVQIRTRTVTEIEVDWEALAKAVDQGVMENLEENLKRWKGDRDMRAMFLHDAADGLEVCEVIRSGDFDKIEERLWDMDTAARDVVRDIMLNAAGPEFERYYFDREGA